MVVRSDLKQIYIIKCHCVTARSYTAFCVPLLYFQIFAFFSTIRLMPFSRQHVQILHVASQRLTVQSRSSTNEYNTKTLEA